MSVTLNNITSGYSTGLINDNFQLVEDELNNNVLRRDGLSSGEANQMEVDLDMNGNAILNVSADITDDGSLLNLGAADLRYVEVAGDTMSGDLDMDGNDVKDIRTTITDNLILGGLPVSPGELNPNQVIWVDTISDLQALDTSELVDGQQVQVGEFHADTGGGGQRVVYSSSAAKSGHGTLGWSPTVPAPSQQAGATLVDKTAAFLDGSGETDGGGLGLFLFSALDRTKAESYGTIPDITIDQAPIIQRAYNSFLSAFNSNDALAFIFPEYEIHLSQLLLSNPLKFDRSQKIQTLSKGIIRQLSTTDFTFKKDPDDGSASANGIRFEGLNIFGDDNIYPMFDCDTIRRLTFSACCFTGVSSCIYSSSYTQTVYFQDGCIIRQGAGWFFDADRLFDVVFDGNIIEHREHFFRTRNTTADPACNSLRITNNLIEGLTGKAIEGGACYGVLVSGNYFEGNQGGDIDFSISSSFHKGLEISNNSIQPWASMGDDYYPIKWGATAGSLISGGNASTGNLHDTTGASRFIHMDGDYASGKLYKDFLGISDPARAPTGYAEYTQINQKHFAVNSRAYVIDPSGAGHILVGSTRSEIVGDVLANTYIVHSDSNPITQPGNFGSRVWARGSKIFKNAVTVEGAAGDQYIVTGYIATLSGATADAEWREMRVLTGT